MQFEWMTLFLLLVWICTMNGKFSMEKAWTKEEDVKFENGYCISKEFGKIPAGKFANGPNECKQAFCYLPDPDKYGLTDDAKLLIHRCVAQITCPYTLRGPGDFPDCCPFNDPVYCDHKTLEPAS